MTSYRNSRSRAAADHAGLAAGAGAAAHRLGPAAVEPLGVPAHPRDPADRRSVARQRPPAPTAARRARSRCAAGRRDSEGRPTTLAGLLDETYTDGFLVLKDGAIVYERYFNGMDERTLHLSQSMAKSVTGCSVRRAWSARGLLDPGAPVTHYLPELGDTAWAGAQRPACARHDERRALLRGVHRSLFRHRPGRRRLRLEAGAARHRSGLSWPAHMFGADPAA